MQLKVPALLADRGWTAYQLAKASDGRISMSAAYRLATGDWKCLSSDVLDALCDTLEVEPGDLFVREGKRRKR